LTSDIAAVEAILQDGTSVAIRSVRPADRERLIALFGRMSPTSVRHRFFGAKRELTESDLRYLTDDGPDVALAATVQHGAEDTILGLGRYVVLPDTPAVAEVAFDVGDADQGRGIGTLLLERLAQIARERGIATFRADVEADNGKMREVFARSGFAIREALRHGAFQVEIPTASTESFLRAAAVRQQVAARRCRRRGGRCEPAVAQRASFGSPSSAK
jgi:GNAT superfamily N-acetyltransferase